MLNSDIPLAQTITTLCNAHGIKHVVISPGSRSAPLTIGFTNDDNYTCYSIVDERCAGFFALGIAQQLQQPVALVCTSGSALLNYYPAISEAYYSNIPIIVLSADRPKFLVDIGEGQTIKQPHVYGKHVCYATNLKLDLRENAKHHSKTNALATTKSYLDRNKHLKNLQYHIQTHNENEINRALVSCNLHKLPAHINCPFDEPLYGTTKNLFVQAKCNITPEKLEYIEKQELDTLIKVWNKSQRKLILVGVLHPNYIEQKWLDELTKDTSVIILTETTSNLHHSHIFAQIDQLITPLDYIELKALQPEVLLTFGGMVVSKKIKTFLRQHKPLHHYHIGPYKANDTFFCLKHHFKSNTNTFLSKFLHNTKRCNSSNYQSYWLKAREKRRKKHNDYLRTAPFSDFLVFNSLLKTLPLKSQLQVGNSSAIRYMQLFQLPKQITVFCNRGTSGIDGSTSTALGAAVFSKKRVTLITGDLSFFYDSNALWNNYIPKDFRIIIINNRGGGIFRILPGHKNTTDFDTYFETKHELSAEQLSTMFGFSYSKARNHNELEQVLKIFYETSAKPKLLEVFTPSELNDDCLLKYFDHIK